MKLIRPIDATVRIISDDGTADFIASDQSLDSYREIIRAAGWQFSMFQRNAPLVDSHNYHSLDRQLGSVLNWEVKGEQLHERVKLAIDVPENALARLAWGMLKGGYLKAVSVGFIPTKYHWRGDDDFAQAATALKLTTEAAAACRCIYWQQEQIELSLCVIGANPNALLKARSEKAITDDDLAAAGLASDDALQFMQTAGKVWDAGDDVLRHGVTSIMTRFHAERATREKTSHGSRPPQGGTPGTQRRPEETAERKRAAEQAFIRSLEKLATNIR